MLILFSVFILFCYHIGQTFKWWRNSYISYWLVPKPNLLNFTLNDWRSLHLWNVSLFIDPDVWVFFVRILTSTWWFILILNNIFMFIQYRALFARLLWNFVYLRKSWLNLVVLVFLFQTLFIIDRGYSFPDTLRGTSIHHFHPVSWYEIHWVKSNLVLLILSI